MNTGPTGYTGPVMIYPTGSTGPSAELLAMFPNESTGPVEPPHIATLEELMASHTATIAKEAVDKETLRQLFSPTRDTFRPQLFQWAAAGFPDLYIVQTFPVTPPAICADGVKREIGKYVEYCIGVDLGAVITALQALMIGIQPSWSMDGNTLRIHVTKS